MTRPALLILCFISLGLFSGCLESVFEDFGEALACSISESYSDNEFYVRPDSEVGHIVGTLFVPGENCDFEDFFFSGGDEYFDVASDGDVVVAKSLMPIEGTSHAVSATVNTGTETIDLDVVIEIIKAPLPTYGVFINADLDTALEISHAYLKLDTVANWFVQQYYFSYGEITVVDNVMEPEGVVVRMTVATTSNLQGLYLLDSIQRDQHIFIESTLGGTTLPDPALLGFYLIYNSDTDDFDDRAIIDARMNIESIELEKSSIHVEGVLANDSSDSLQFSYNGAFEYLHWD
ncbi:MAG: hypothetical protein JXQ90_13775 [Cyclobacteriaceae bacterium]